MRSGIKPTTTPRTSRPKAQFILACVLAQNWKKWWPLRVPERAPTERGRQRTHRPFQSLLLLRCHQKRLNPITLPGGIRSHLQHNRAQSAYLQLTMSSGQNLLPHRTKPSVIGRNLPSADTLSEFVSTDRIIFRYNLAKVGPCLQDGHQSGVKGCQSHTTLFIIGI